MTSRQRCSGSEGGEESPRCRAPPGGSRDIGGRGSTGHVGIGARGVGELSRAAAPSRQRGRRWRRRRRRRDGGEGGDGHDEGGLTKWMTPSRNMTSSMSSSSSRLSSFIRKCIAVARSFCGVACAIKLGKTLTKKSSKGELVLLLLLQLRDRISDPRARSRHPRDDGALAGCFRRFLHFVFVFSLGGPTPSEAAGGRPLTERSKRETVRRVS